MTTSGGETLTGTVNGSQISGTSFRTDQGGTVTGTITGTGAADGNSATVTDVWTYGTGPTICSGTTQTVATRLGGVVPDPGTGDTGDTSSAGSDGTCTLPSCLNLDSNCTPTGSCVQQMPTPSLVNVCYLNGLKGRVVETMGSFSGTITVWDGSTLCYSNSWSDSGPATGGTLTGPTGATLATYTVNASGAVVTCAGSQPVTLDTTCYETSVLSIAPAHGRPCQQGVCSLAKATQN
jgi:hypothetical protein